VSSCFYILFLHLCFLYTFHGGSTAMASMWKLGSRLILAPSDIGISHPFFLFLRLSFSPELGIRFGRQFRVLCSLKQATCSVEKSYTSHEGSSLCIA
jgi:hypothetical protein